MQVAVVVLTGVVEVHQEVAKIPEVPGEVEVKEEEVEILLL